MNVEIPPQTPPEIDSRAELEALKEEVAMTDEEIEETIAKADLEFEMGLSPLGMNVYGQVKRALAEIAKNDGDTDSILKINEELIEQILKTLEEDETGDEKVAAVILELGEFLVAYEELRASNNYTPNVALMAVSEGVNLVPAIGSVKIWGESAVGYKSDGTPMTGPQRLAHAKGGLVDASIDLAFAATTGGLATAGKKVVQGGRLLSKTRKASKAADAAKVGGKLGKKVGPATERLVGNYEAWVKAHPKLAARTKKLEQARDRITVGKAGVKGVKFALKRGVREDGTEEASPLENLVQQKRELMDAIAEL